MADDADARGRGSGGRRVVVCGRSAPARRRSTPAGADVYDRARRSNSRRAGDAAGGRIGGQGGRAVATECRAAGRFQERAEGQQPIECRGSKGPCTHRQDRVHAAAEPRRELDAGRTPASSARVAEAPAAPPPPSVAVTAAEQKQASAGQQQAVQAEEARQRRAAQERWCNRRRCNHRSSPRSRLPRLRKRRRDRLNHRRDRNRPRSQLKVPPQYRRRQVRRIPGAHAAGCRWPRWGSPQRSSIQDRR